MPGIKDWLKKALSDLKAAKKLSDDNETFDCSVFHTHQCAEKALKAFIVSSHQAVPKTHDLKLLLGYCLEISIEFLLIKEESKSLNSYGQDARYPNDIFYVDQKRVNEAICMAEKILLIIQNLLLQK